jgi:hypothetical protein
LRRKASWYVSEARGGIKKQLKHLMAGINPLSGIVFIENRSQPFTLDNSLGQNRGNLVIVASGGVQLSSLSPGVTGGLTTVISYGSLVVDGEVNASVISDKRISVSPFSVIKGNLILRELRDPSALQGKVIRSTKYHSGRTVPGDTSGAYIDYYFVEISPCSTFTVLERN